MMVCQLALARGASVIGTAGKRNLEFLRSRGVIPVLYGDRLAGRVAGITEETGPLTAVVDCHGREALDAGVALGVPAQRMTATAAYAALAELGVPNVDFDARTAQNLAALADEIAAGHVTVPISGTFTLDEVVQAFEALEKSHAPGKIVIVP